MFWKCPLPWDHDFMWLYMASFRWLSTSLKERNTPWGAETTMLCADSLGNTCGCQGINPRPTLLVDKGKVTQGQSLRLSLNSQEARLFLFKLYVM